MRRTGKICFSLLVAAIVGITAAPVSAEPAERLMARIEYVSAADSFTYQSTAAQLIEKLADTNSSRPAQLLANTSSGFGFLYISESEDTSANTTPEAFWESVAGQIDQDRAAQADELVSSYRNMQLIYLPELSYRPPTPRSAEQDRRFLSFFIYGLPRDKRAEFEAMGKDYNQLCRERGVNLWSETYEIESDGDELRFLVAKAAAGAPDFWRSEAQLDAAIQGERFERIGLQAEAMFTSVEFLSAVPMSQGFAQSPMLRD